MSTPVGYAPAGYNISHAEEFAKIFSDGKLPSERESLSDKASRWFFGRKEYTLQGTTRTRKETLELLAKAHVLLPNCHNEEKTALEYFCLNWHPLVGRHAFRLEHDYERDTYTLRESVQKAPLKEPTPASNWIFS